jgi:hypothetical protein
MQKLLTVFPLLCACIPKPYPLPEQTPEPTPEPTPSPTIEGINAPSIIPTFTPFTVSYCAGDFEFNQQVTIDSHPIGTLGWNSQSQCHQIIVPGLNKPGSRTIDIKDIGQTKINVIQWSKQ